MGKSTTEKIEHQVHTCAQVHNMLRGEIADIDHQSLLDVEWSVQAPRVVEVPKSRKLLQQK